jgi:hypothetical protein
MATRWGRENVWARLYGADQPARLVRMMSSQLKQWRRPGAGLPVL